jgi:hypothetical protein
MKKHIRTHNQKKADFVTKIKYASRVLKALVTLALAGAALLAALHAVGGGFS